MSKALFRDLTVLFEHLEKAQGAGVPIRETLDESHNMVDCNKLRLALVHIGDKVKAGADLSREMEAFPGLFSPVLVSLVRTGEQTGELTRSFHLCKEHVKWLENYRSQISRMTRTPVFALGIFLILEFVTGTFVVRPLLFILVIGYLFIKFGGARKGIVKDKLDRIVLIIPGLGEWFEKFSLAQYAASFSYLYKSGMDIHVCLKQSARACENTYIREALNDVARNVKNGQSLYQSFADTGRFSPTVYRLIKTGEQTGNLAHVMAEMSTSFYQDVTDSMDLMMKTLPSVITIILGIMFIKMFF
mgnify:CR=1 FL=1